MRTGRWSRTGQRWAAAGGALALSAVMLAAAHVAAAAAVTLFVDNTSPHCSDAGPGTSDAPFCTIGQGAATVSPNGSVVVLAGTYPERVSMARPGPATFRAAGPVTITGQANGFNINGTSDITVQGFTITNTSSNGIQVQNSTGIQVLGNVITDSGLAGSQGLAHGIFLNGVTSSLVRGNFVNHNTDSGVYVDAATSGTMIDGNLSANNARGLIGLPRGATGITVIGPNNTVINNFAYLDEDSGIFVDAGGDGTLIANNVSYDNGDHGIDNHNVTGGRVVGNSVYHNCTSGINVEGASAGNYLIENNIAVDNAFSGNPCSRSLGDIRVADAAVTSTVVNFNLVWPPGDSSTTPPTPIYVWGTTNYYSLTSFTAATGQDSSGMEADPGWVNQSPSNPDLHLRESSPAVDSADSSASGEQPADRDGVARLDDPNVANTGGGPAPYYDRGAYEFLPSLARTGYDLVATDGGMFTFGGAGFFGSTGGKRLNKPVVGMAATPSGHGYWLVASDGGIFTFGDAAFLGSTGGKLLNKPVVGMAATPSGHGYWLVASDGGIFTFGDAAFLGSTGGLPLNKPIVAMAASPTGHGYWLVASDGGIFTFGDAAFLGSTGGVHLNKPVVGMAATPSGHGYWLVATDGGIFSFGDAAFHGSTGGLVLNRPVVGMASTPTGQGYRLVASDGGIFTFGDALFAGSTGGLPLNKPIVGMTRAL
jgi:ribosomal protein L24E